MMYVKIVMKQLDSDERAMPVNFIFLNKSSSLREQKNNVSLQCNGKLLARRRRFFRGA